MEQAIGEQTVNVSFWDHVTNLMKGFTNLSDFFLFVFGKTEFNYNACSEIFEKDITKVVQIVVDLLLIRINVKLPDGTNLLVTPKKTRKAEDIVNINLEWSGSSDFIADVVGLNVSIKYKKYYFDVFS